MVANLSREDLIFKAALCFNLAYLLHPLHSNHIMHSIDLPK